MFSQQSKTLLARIVGVNQEVDGSKGEDPDVYRCFNQRKWPCAFPFKYSLRS